MSFDTAIDLSNLSIELTDGSFCVASPPAPVVMQGAGVEISYDILMVGGNFSLQGLVVYSDSVEITQEILMSSEFHLARPLTYSQGKGAALGFYTRRDPGDDTVQIVPKMARDYIIDMPFAPKIHPASNANPSWLIVKNERINLSRATLIHDYVKAGL